MAPATPTFDYYVKLEVSSNACLEDIKASYRRLARQHHPDKNLGSYAATARTQEINAAWEVLRDPVKRTEYDRTRPQGSYSTPNHSKPPEYASEEQYNWQSTQPNKPAQEDVQAEEESREKRQKWLKFEMSQEQLIRRTQNQIKQLEAEIAAHNEKIAERLPRISPPLFKFWLSFTPLADAEKDDLKRQILNSENAIRIKQVTLDYAQGQLKELQLELARCRALEESRLKAEQARKEGRRTNAWEKAEAERRKAAWEQKLREAREKDESEERIRREAEDKWRMHREMLARARAIREEAAREAAKEMLREAREKAENEERRRREEEGKWRMHREMLARARAIREEAAREAVKEKLRESILKAQKALEKENERLPTNQQGKNNIPKQKNGKGKKKKTVHNPPVNHAHPTTSGNPKQCTHQYWWEKNQGRQKCENCPRMLGTFYEKCPGCGIKACASCRNLLKRAATTSHRASPQYGYVPPNLRKVPAT